MTRADIEDFFAAIGPVRARPMFGGHGVYLDGLMFALEAGGELFLKSDGETEALFAAAASKQFVYEGKKGSTRMSYWSAPDEALDDADALRLWCGRALAAARRAKQGAHSPRRRVSSPF